MAANALTVIAATAMNAAIIAVAWIFCGRHCGCLRCMCRVLSVYMHRYCTCFKQCSCCKQYASCDILCHKVMDPTTYGVMCKVHKLCLPGFLRAQKVILNYARVLVGQIKLILAARLGWRFILNADLIYFSFKSQQQTPENMYTLCCCLKSWCPWFKSGGILGRMIWLCGCKRKQKKRHELVLLLKEDQSPEPFPLIGPMLGPDCIITLSVAALIAIISAGFMKFIAPYLPNVSHMFCPQTKHIARVFRFFVFSGVHVGGWSHSIVLDDCRVDNFLFCSMHQSRFGEVRSVMAVLCMRNLSGVNDRGHI